MFKIFTRGGQTTLHGFRMFKQVVFAVFFVFILVSVASFTTKLVKENNKYELSFLVGFYLEKARIEIKGYECDRRTTIRNPRDGSHIEYTNCMINTLAITYGLEEIESKIYGHMIVSFFYGIGAASLPLLWFVFAGYRVGRKIHKKGGQLVKPMKLRKLILKHNATMRTPWFKKILTGNKYQPYLFINNIPFSWRSETTHTIITGSVGTGKTVTINKYIKQVMERGDRAVILDILGAYIEKFYNPKKHIILNPFDKRSENWSLQNEIINPDIDIDMITEALIPETKNGDAIWYQSARVIFSEALSKLYKIGTCSNHDILDLFDLNIKEIAKFLEGTAAAGLINPDAPKQAAGLIMNLKPFLRPLRIVPEGKNSFSITKWVKDDRDGRVLFLSSNLEMHPRFKGLHSLWFHIAISRLLSSSRSSDRLFWFFLDELAALQPIPAIQLGMQMGRQFGAVFVLGIQAMSQLSQIYGREGARTISSLCRNRIVLSTTDFATAKMESDNLGQEEILTSNETKSWGHSEVRDGESLGQNKETKGIVIPGEIQNLANLEGFIKIAGSFPVAKVKIKYIDYPEIAKGFILRDIKIHQNEVKSAVHGKDENKQKRHKKLKINKPTNPKISKKNDVKKTKTNIIDDSPIGKTSHEENNLENIFQQDFSQGSFFSPLEHEAIKPANEIRDNPPAPEQDMREQEYQEYQDILEDELPPKINMDMERD